MIRRVFTSSDRFRFPSQTMSPGSRCNGICVANSERKMRLSSSHVAKLDEVTTIRST